MSTTDSSDTLTRWGSRVLDHVGRYGLTTHAAVRKAVFGDQAADEELVAAVLASLLQDGKLFQHGRVLWRSKTRPTPETVSRRYAALHLCELQSPPFRLLSRADVADIMAPATEHLGIGLRKEVRCIIDREKRLSLLRVQALPARGEEPDLNRDMSRLQATVQDETFRPWLYLARRGGFSLSYVLHDQDHVKEFALWTARRPPASTLLGEPIAIPVCVHVVPPITKKNKAP